MADETETTQAETQAAQPSVDELMEQVRALTEERDKAREQSRKWEGRSKSNAEKAKRYDEIAAKSMTDAERANEATRRAEDAERRLAEYEAEAQRSKDAAEVSEAYGIPASLLTERDRDAMERQAQAIKAYADGRPASQVFEGDGKRPGTQPQTANQAFHDWFQNAIR